jgi:hypothetical protein
MDQLSLYLAVTERWFFRRVVDAGVVVAACFVNYINLSHDSGIQSKQYISGMF